MRLYLLVQLPSRQCYSSPFHRQQPYLLLLFNFIMIKKPFSHAQSPWSTWKIGKIAWDNPMVLPGQKKNVLCPSYSLISFTNGTGAHAGEGQKKKLRVSEVVCAFFFCLFRKTLDSFPMRSCNKLDLWDMPAIIRLVQVQCRWKKLTFWGAKLQNGCCAYVHSS